MQTRVRTLWLITKSPYIISTFYVLVHLIFYSFNHLPTYKSSEYSPIAQLQKQSNHPCNFQQQDEDGRGSETKANHIKAGPGVLKLPLNFANEI